MNVDFFVHICDMIFRKLRTIHDYRHDYMNIRWTCMIVFVHLHFRHTGQTDISPTMFNYMSLWISNGVESVRFQSKVVRRFWTALPRPSRVTSLFRRVETRIGSCFWVELAGSAKKSSWQDEHERTQLTLLGFQTIVHCKDWMFPEEGCTYVSYLMIYRFKDESSTRASCIAVRYGASKPFETILPSCTGIISKPSSGSLLSNE